MDQSALAVGLDRGTMDHFLSRAGSGHLAVDCVALAQQGAMMAGSRRYELVACTYPLPDMVMREFCRTVRQPGSASRDAAFLVLSLPDMQAEAQRALPSGRTLVRSRHDHSPLLHEAIVHLLRVAPRRALDVPVELRPENSNQNDAIKGCLVNVSRSGLLVAHSHPPTVGFRFCFTFSTDTASKPISGKGEVVRHARAGRDAATGFAMRITSLLPGAEKRLMGFLEPAL